MDIGSLLLIIALTIIVAGFVARPLLDRAAARDSVAGTSDLTTQREAVLTELRELDFDHDTGKITADDYQVQRKRLVETGARILRALDQLQAAHAEDDDVERLVAARRQHPAASGDAVEARGAARRQHPAASGDAVEARGAARRQRPATSDDAVEARIAARRSKPAAAGDDAIEAQVAARRAKPSGAASGPTCPKCHNSVQAADKFCPHCGAKLI